MRLRRDAEVLERAQWLFFCLFTKIGEYWRAHNESWLTLSHHSANSASQSSHSITFLLFVYHILLFLIPVMHTVHLHHSVINEELVLLHLLLIVSCYSILLFSFRNLYFLFKYRNSLSICLYICIYRYICLI